nr:hypothetical protein [bacterium]
MFEFKLPDLGEGIHEGEVLKWHVQPGDTIAEDAPLVEVETDKAAVTIPSPRGGKVMTVVGEVGDVVETGQVIAVIDDGSGEAVAEAAPAATGRAAEEMPVGVPEEAPEPAAAPTPAPPAPRAETTHPASRLPARPAPPPP